MSKDELLRLTAQIVAGAASSDTNVQAAANPKHVDSYIRKIYQTLKAINNNDDK